MAISAMRSLCFLLFFLSDDSIAFTTLPARNVQRVSLIRRQHPAWQPAQSKIVTWQYPNVGVREKASNVPVSPSHPSYKPDQRHSLLFAARSHPTKSPHGAGTSRLKRWVQSLRKLAKTFLLATLLTFSLRDSAWAVSAGRAGGSFGPSSSSRSSSPSSSSIRSGPSTRVYYSPIRVYPSRGYYPFRDYSPTRLYNSVTYEAPALRITRANIVLLSGTCVLIAYGFTKVKKESDLSNPLGPGVSVASITVALDVPDRDDPACILNKLKRIVEAADTGTRKGVQTLVSNGT
jgi:hypothetical protein